MQRLARVVVRDERRRDLVAAFRLEERAQQTRAEGVGRRRDGPEQVVERPGERDPLVRPEVFHHAAVDAAEQAFQAGAVEVGDAFALRVARRDLGQVAVGAEHADACECGRHRQALGAVSEGVGGGGFGGADEVREREPGSVRDGLFPGVGRKLRGGTDRFAPRARGRRQVGAAAVDPARVRERGDAVGAAVQLGVQQPPDRHLDALDVGPRPRRGGREDHQDAAGESLGGVVDHVGVGGKLQATACGRERL